MIDLTPLDVRQKKADFPRGLRGYDPGHVEDFLNLVADRLEALVKENRRLAEEVATLKAAAGEYRDREKALTEALVSAQQMREEVREQSAKEAELLRREAAQDARRLRNDALVAIEKEEETLRRLRARQRQLVDGYRGMLERELRELAVVAEALDAADAAAAPGSLPGRPDASRAGGQARRASSAELVAPAIADAAADDGATAEGEAADDAQDADDLVARVAEAAEDAPAAARDPASDERGQGRDRFAGPAASHGRSGPRGDAGGERPGPRADARDERGEPAGDEGSDERERHPRGEEPDWLAAILKEE